MHVFISYSRQDIAHARALHEELSVLGHEPWLDLHDIQPGADWRSEIRSAIERADVVLLVVSPWSMASETVRAEWQHARANAKQTLLLAVQSVRPQEVRAAWGAQGAVRLASLSWIDVRAAPQRAGQQVAAWLKDDSSRRAQGAAFPAPPPRPLFFLERLPPVAHRSAWAQILGGAMCIALLIAFLVQSVRWQTPAATPFLDRVATTGWILIALGGIYLAGSTVRRGLLAFYRKENRPHNSLLEAAAPLIGTGGLLLLSAGAEFFGRRRYQIPASALPLDVQLGYGVLLLTFGLLLAYIARRHKASAVLQRWLPAYSERQTRWQRSKAARTRPGIERTAPASEPSILADRPVQHVTLAFARQDAGFGRSLRHSLVRRGLAVSETLSDAHTDALVVVLTPWAVADARVERAWRQAMGSGVPVLPILLEETQAPGELAELNWIDARTDLARARSRVLDALQGEPIEPETPAQAILVAPGRSSVYGPPLPKTLNLLAIWLVICVLYKAMLVAALLPISLWGYPELEPGHWAAAVAIFLVAYLQGIALGAFLFRRLAYLWMTLVQALSALATLALLGHLWPAINWSLGLGPDRSISIVLGIYEAIVLCALVLPPACREWSASGRAFKLDRIQPALWVGYPVCMCIIALVCALPVLGPAPEIHSSGGPLRAGETVLARLSADIPAHTWTFGADPGDRVTLYVGALSHKLDPVVRVRDQSGAAIVVEDGGGYLWDAQVKDLRLDGGTYRADVGAWVPRGVYRLTLSVLETPPD